MYLIGLALLSLSWAQSPGRGAPKFRVDYTYSMKGTAAYLRGVEGLCEASSPTAERFLGMSFLAESNGYKSMMFGHAMVRAYSCNRGHFRQRLFEYLPRFESFFDDGENPSQIGQFKYIFLKLSEGMEVFSRLREFTYRGGYVTETFLEVSEREIRSYVREMERKLDVQKEQAHQWLPPRVQYRVGSMDCTDILMGEVHYLSGYRSLKNRWGLTPRALTNQILKTSDTLAVIYPSGYQIQSLLRRYDENWEKLCELEIPRSHRLPDPRPRHGLGMTGCSLDEHPVYLYLKSKARALSY